MMRRTTSNIEYKQRMREFAASLEDLVQKFGVSYQDTLQTIRLLPSFESERDMRLTPKIWTLLYGSLLGVDELKTEETAWSVWQYYDLHQSKTMSRDTKLVTQVPGDLFQDLTQFHQDGMVTPRSFHSFLVNMGFDKNTCKIMLGLFGFLDTSLERQLSFLEDNGSISGTPYRKCFTTIEDIRSIASMLLRKLRQRSNGGSGSDPRFVQVFLGGSKASYATWRQEIAIPYLDAKKIHYFNPQRSSHLYQNESVVLNRIMTAFSDVLIFGIAKESRALVSMLEAVEYMCTGMKVLTVINEVQEGSYLGSEICGKYQAKDINRARLYMIDVSRRHNCMVFKDTSLACETAVRMIHEKYSRSKDTRFSTRNFLLWRFLGSKKFTDFIEDSLTSLRKKHASQRRRSHSPTDFTRGREARTRYALESSKSHGAPKMESFSHTRSQTNCLLGSKLSAITTMRTAKLPLYRRLASTDRRESVESIEPQENQHWDGVLKARGIAENVLKKINAVLVGMFDEEYKLTKSIGRKKQKKKLTSPRRRKDSADLHNLSTPKVRERRRSLLEIKSSELTLCSAREERIHPNLLIEEDEEGCQKSSIEYDEDSRQRSSSFKKEDRVHSTDFNMGHNPGGVRIDSDMLLKTKVDQKSTSKFRVHLGRQRRNSEGLSRAIGIVQGAVKKMGSNRGTRESRHKHSFTPGERAFPLREAMEKFDELWPIFSGIAAPTLIEAHSNAGFRRTRDESEANRVLTELVTYILLDAYSSQSDLDDELTASFNSSPFTPTGSVSPPKFGNKFSREDHRESMSLRKLQTSGLLKSVQNLYEECCERIEKETTKTWSWTNWKVKKGDKDSKDNGLNHAMEKPTQLRRKGFINTLMRKGLTRDSCEKIAAILQVPQLPRPGLSMERFGHNVYMTLYSHNVSFSNIALAEEQEFKSMQSSLSTVDVFLGGACNPTTWRKDVAIPIFKDKKVTYYNPQVENWTQDLIVLESLVKASSRILLFVLSGQTRAISSMIEVTEYIFTGRDVVLVIQEMIKGVTIQGEEIPNVELRELNNARNRLRKMAKRFDIPVFNTVGDACMHICNRLDHTSYEPGRVNRLLESKKTLEAFKASWEEYPKDPEGMLTFRGICQMMRDIHSQIEPIIRGGLQQPSLTDIKRIANACNWNLCKWGRVREGYLRTSLNSIKTTPPFLKRPVNVVEEDKQTAMCRSTDFKGFIEFAKRVIRVSIVHSL
ncbi:hypothetical protein AAMO2058_001469700 [Amorphochlora amoebiformis]